MTRAVLLLALLLLALPTPARAADRIDFFDPRGTRTGYATVDRETGRVDYYDVRSRHVGWGQLDPSGRVEGFDRRGNRMGSSAAPRIMLAPTRPAPRR